MRANKTGATGHQDVFCHKVFEAAAAVSFRPSERAFISAAKRLSKTAFRPRQMVLALHQTSRLRRDGPQTICFEQPAKTREQPMGAAVQISAHCTNFLPEAQRLTA